MFKKLMLVFKYGPEIEEILKEQRRQAAEAAFKARASHLKLCLKHQQEEQRSHYSKHNCDYCNLLAKVNKGP
jgi:hypothetical protein